MDPVSVVTGRAVPIAINNIDTDSIIPARFLKMTTRDNAQLARGLFHHWRFDDDGSPKDFALNKPEYQGANILLAGDNFGCGSSREKAPWALLAYGFQAVVSTSIADIFRSNALKNGLVPVIVDAASHRELFAVVSQNPDTILTIDVASQTISWEGRSSTFPIESFSKTCLLKGVDQLGYLLGYEKMITAFELQHPPAPMASTRRD